MVLWSVEAAGWCRVRASPPHAAEGVRMDGRAWWSAYRLKDWKPEDSEQGVSYRPHSNNQKTTYSSFKLPL